MKVIERITAAEIQLRSPPPRDQFATEVEEFYFC